MIKVGKKARWATIAVGIVACFEGLRTYVYLDPVGIPTYCFGETLNPKPGKKYTVSECEDLLADRLQEFDQGMMACVRVPLRDETRAALVSFTYNVGIGAFCKSTLARKLNAGDTVGACNELTKWNRARGITLPGLTRRRAEERALCLKGAA
jgi:lysozyme